MTIEVPGQPTVNIDIATSTATVSRPPGLVLNAAINLPAVEVGIPGIPGPASGANPVMVLTEAQYLALPFHDAQTVYVLI